MRRAARVDSNQKAIVNAFRQCGFSVFHTHTIGGGFPDIVAGYGGINYLIEIKDGSLPPSARKLTKPEETFHQNWRGQVCIINDVDEVFAFKESL